MEGPGMVWFHGMMISGQFGRRRKSVA